VPTLDGPRVPPADGGPARQLVVLLHGVGADGADLINLAEPFAAALPGAAFVAPNAPEPCDMAPFGHQWFSLQVRTPERLLLGTQAAAPLLDAFLDAELARHGLDDGALAVVGFSQGTMMALYAVPRRARACAGLLCYSGALLAGERLAAEARAKPPILLVHGDADDVVPVAAMQHAVQSLQAAGFDVEGRVRPGLPHGIDPGGIDLGVAFLRRCFGTAL
jgi:phospholipase/carboxylesterase